MKTKSSLHPETQAPSTRSRVGSVRYLVIAMIMTISSAYGQARLTNPTAGSQLPHPNFILTWNNVGASEYYISLGSRQGLSDHFGSNTGRNTSVGITWQVGRPVGVWVRIWSRVRINSGFANSTTAGEQWVVSDSYHPLAQPPVNHAPELISSFLSTATAPGRGVPVGECKAFLQGAFNRAAGSFRLPSGASPIMPPNLNGSNTTTTNWKWQDSASSGFVVAGAVDPDARNRQGSPIGDAEKRLRVLALLRQVRRGDTIQVVWKRSASFNGTQASQYGPHTMAFLQDFRDMTSPMNVVHSNMDGRGTLQIGPETTWGPITPASLADRIAAQMGGATLYRVRSDVQRR
jgi:hypothetical protein